MIYDNITKNIAFKEGKNDILKSYPFNEIIEYKQSVSKQSIKLAGINYIQYLFPIRHGQMTKSLGLLVIGISIKKIQLKLVGITYRLVLTSFILFLALTITIYILSNRFVRPIKKLSDMVGKLAGGDHSVRSDLDVNDEIGGLAKAFNMLADKINEQIDSIGKYSKNLEEMVKERTKELRGALENIKEKEEKLNQAKNITSLNTLLTSIAHEINNPMAIISGNMQMLESEVARDNRDKKRIKVVQDAISRIENLINDINFLSTIKDMTKFNFSFSNILHRVVRDVVPGNIEVKISGCEDDYINSNQNLISICLENVLKNSVDILNKRNIKGQILINFFWQEFHFVIVVVDNGGGIEDPDKIFEPFYSNSEAKKGLGLTFVFHAIQSLNGDIKIENYGSGARVTLKIPKLSTGK